MSRSNLLILLVDVPRFEPVKRARKAAVRPDAHSDLVEDRRRKPEIRYCSFQQHGRELTFADARTETGEAIRLSRQFLPDLHPHRHEATNRRL